MNFRLDYDDGAFIIVFPLSIRESRKLMAYYLEFRKAIANSHVYPETLDDVLFPRFKFYYQRISQFFGFTPEKLTQISRHHFFVATEPFQYKGETVPGLSYLQRLLGYDYPNESSNSSSSIDTQHREIISTGDPNLDIVADALLIFKVGGLENYYSLEELAKLCKQANERLRQAEELAREESKGGDENLESESLDEDFVKNKARLYNWLVNLGVDVPVEF